MRTQLAILLALAALFVFGLEPVVARGTGGAGGPGPSRAGSGSRTRVAAGSRGGQSGRTPRRGAPRREARGSPSGHGGGRTRSGEGGPSASPRRDAPNRRPPRRPDLPARRAVQRRHETALQGSPRVRFEETRTLADGTVVTRTTVPGGVKRQPEGSRTEALKDKVLTNNEILTGEMVHDTIRAAEALRKLKGKEKLR